MQRKLGGPTHMHRVYLCVSTFLLHKNHFLSAYQSNRDDLEQICPKILMTIKMVFTQNESQKYLHLFLKDQLYEKTNKDDFGFSDYVEQVQIM